MSSAPAHDVAVVGAGAAGLIAAIAAGREAPAKSIVLFDGRTKIGAKILVSGGTRCNVTNARVTPSDYHGGPSHFVKHVLEAFTPLQTMRFFGEIGVEFVLEPTGKYFPSTHSGKTVLEALVREAGRAGVKLVTGAKVTDVRPDGEEFILSTDAGSVRARRVVLATGGLSYPETGSDGTGLVIAEKLGHRLAERSPALTPLVSSDAGWKSLSGIAVEAELSFFRKGKKGASTRGPLLFTHFGLSGPSALDVSRHFARCPKEEAPEIFADFIPDHKGPAEDFFDRVGKSTRSLKNFLVERFALPARFVEVFMEKNGLDPSAVAARLSKPHQRKLVELLRRAPLSVTGVVGYKKAEVTAGGVELGEVRAATMESKKVPGLHFAGEILDVDGRIGGFNFQWAWSSGTLAGRAAAKGAT